MSNDEADDKFRGSFQLFSPRWGHSDEYYVEMSRDALLVEQNTKQAECRLSDEREAVWSGHDSTLENPLLQIMSDDSIYAPAIVPDAMEYLFVRWHDREIDNATVSQALSELFEWIDATARAKPSSSFWSSYF